jgi:cytoskeletal protein RodZ
MAEMRLRARLSALFAVLLLLALPVVAAAEIKPIPKPDSPPPPPAKVPKKPVSSPPPPPSLPPSSTSTPATTAGSTQTATTTGSTTSTTTGTTAGTTTTATTEKIVVAISEGDRDQSGVVVPAIPPPDPTPLATVAASEPLPSQGSGTPPWKLALLALLAAAEAFLVVRLVRHRPAPLSPAAQ